MLRRLLAANGSVGDTFSADEIVQTGGQFFGSVSQGLASLVEKAASQFGLPNGYILGEEGSAPCRRRPLRRGHALYPQRRSVPAVLAGPVGRLRRRRRRLQGHDAGLQSQLHHDAFGRYPGVDGSAYAIGATRHDRDEEGQHRPRPRSAQGSVSVPASTAARLLLSVLGAALVELAHPSQQRLAVLLAERGTDAADLDQLADVSGAPAQNLFQHRVRGDGVGRLAIRTLPPPRPQPLERRDHRRSGSPYGLTSATTLAHHIRHTQPNTNQRDGGATSSRRGGATRSRRSHVEEQPTRAGQFLEFAGPRASQPPPLVRPCGSMRFPVQLMTTYAGDLPDTLATLALQLEHGGDQAPPYVLGIASALTDLRTSAASVVAGRGMLSQRDRTSLRRDLGRAIDELGPTLKDELQPALKTLTADLGRLPALLSEAGGAMILRSGADAVLDVLKRPALCVAAWRDAKRSFDADANPDECEVRIRQLAELSALRGVEWRTLARSLRGILFDSRLALADLGLSEFPADVSQVHTPAGVPLAARLEHVETALSQDLDRADLTAWVCFAPASLSNGYVKTGAVEFFGDGFWTETTPEDGGRGNLRAFPEFDSDPPRWLFSDLPHPPFVLARVPLGVGPIAGAADRARGVAGDLVRAAQPYSEWMLVKGAPLYAHSGRQQWFGERFEASAVERETRYQRLTAVYEPSGQGLERLDVATTAAILARAPQMHDALRGAEWAEAVATVPDAAQRVALGLRLIERCLPSCQAEDWPASVRRYLKPIWQDWVSRRSIIDAAHCAVEILEGPLPVAGQAAPWRDRLTPIVDSQTRAIHLRETLRALPEIRAELQTDTMQARVIAQLDVRAASPGNWVAYLNNLGEQFDVLLDRSVRQRNAVLHGADTVTAVVASVGDFVRFMQDAVVQHELAAASSGDTVLSRLERDSIRVRSCVASLEAGRLPVDAIFPADAG